MDSESFDELKKLRETVKVAAELRYTAELQLQQQIAAFKLFKQTKEVEIQNIKYSSQMQLEVMQNHLRNALNKIDELKKIIGNKESINKKRLQKIVALKKTSNECLRRLEGTHAVKRKRKKATKERDQLSSRNEDAPPNDKIIDVATNANSTISKSQAPNIYQPQFNGDTIEELKRWSEGFIEHITRKPSHPTTLANILVEMIHPHKLQKIELTGEGPYALYRGQQRGALMEIISKVGFRQVNSCEEEMKIVKRFLVIFKLVSKTYCQLLKSKGEW